MVVGAGFVIAVHLHHGLELPYTWSNFLRWGLPGIICMKLLIFHSLGLYEGIWRHAGTPEAVRLVSASALASIAVGSVLVVVTDEWSGMGAILVIDWGVVTLGIGGVRFGFRALRQYLSANRKGQKRVLVFGSGSDEMLILRYLRHHPEMDRRVVGLVDGDEGRRGHRVQGVEVLGAPEDLDGLCAVHGIDEVIVPLQTTSEAERIELRGRCSEIGVGCRYFDVRFRSSDHGYAEGRFGLRGSSDDIDRRVRKNGGEKQNVALRGNGESKETGHFSLNREEDGVQSRLLAPGTLCQIAIGEAERCERHSHSESTLLLVRVAEETAGNGKRISDQLRVGVMDAIDAEVLRTSDYVSAWSPSLYVCLLTETGLEGAQNAETRLRKELKAIFTDVLGKAPRVDTDVRRLRPDLDLKRVVEEVRATGTCRREVRHSWNGL
jgi:hypothetical protein